MTLVEFEKLLIEDESIGKKFAELRDERRKAASNEEEFRASLKEIVKELGYEIDESELALDAIASKEIDDEELEKVSGGSRVRQCLAANNCYVLLNHPSGLDKNAACYDDFLCQLYSHLSSDEDPYYRYK